MSSLKNVSYETTHVRKRAKKKEIVSFNFLRASPKSPSFDQPSPSFFIVLSFHSDLLEA